MGMPPAGRAASPPPHPGAPAPPRSAAAPLAAAPRAAPPPLDPTSSRSKPFPSFFPTTHFRRSPPARPAPHSPAISAHAARFAAQDANAALAPVTRRHEAIKPAMGDSTD